jgi:hypothetical protein
MKILPLLALVAAIPAAHAEPVTIRLDAPSYAGKEAALYRYMDLFTLRLERIASGRVDEQGHLALTADVTGTVRALLRIGKTGADLYLRPGSYHAQMPPPEKGEVQPLSGITKVDLLFPDLDALDVNALVGDLNTRLDGFLASNLASDPDAGMQAVKEARSGGAVKLVPDSVERPDLYLYPTWDEARVDSFGRKLKRFYAAVHDPWFQHDVEYGIAGLELGPRSDDRTLFNRYLKDRPVLYDVPEYIRFFRNFFADHLLRFPFRTDTDKLIAWISAARTDSLKKLLARNDFLQDPRLNELVLINGLYAQQANKQFDRSGIVKVLEQVRDGSEFPEHRTIAANMLWDLTAMTAGTALPNVDVLDTAGQRIPLQRLLEGRTCLLVTDIGNPYSERELAALAELYSQYRQQAQVISIAVDRTAGALAEWLRKTPYAAWSWYIPADQRLFLDALRIRNAPVLFLLDGDQLVRSPGPLPSQGLGAYLHGLQVKDKEKHRLRPDGIAPAPRH